MSTPKIIVPKIPDHQSLIKFFILQDFYIPIFGRKQPNGLRYLRVGGLGFTPKMRKNSKREKCLKMPQNPTRQVHALLAALLCKTR